MNEMLMGINVDELLPRRYAQFALMTGSLLFLPLAFAPELLPATACLSCCWSGRHLLRL